MVFVDFTSVSIYTSLFSIRKLTCSGAGAADVDTPDIEALLEVMLLLRRRTWTTLRTLDAMHSDTLRFCFGVGIGARVSSWLLFFSTVVRLSRVCRDALAARNPLRPIVVGVIRLASVREV